MKIALLQINPTVRDLAGNARLILDALRIAYRRGLLHSRFRRYARTNAIPVLLSISIVFAASIPLALVSPLLATLFWIATLFVPRRFIAIFANRALGPDSQ